MRLLLSLASHTYLFAALLYLAYFVRPNARVAKFAGGALGVGVALHTFVIIGDFVQRGYPHVHELDDALSLLAWMFAAGFLYLLHRWSLPSIGVFVMPLVVAAMLPAVLSRGAPTPLPASLARAGMPAHILVAFFGLAALGLSAGVAAAWLALERQMKGKRFGVFYARLPSLQTLDDVSNRLMRWGFVALSLTLMSGAHFAKQVWGDYWRWDPKLTLSLVGWLVYAGLVLARTAAGWRGRRAAMLTVVGFAILLGSFVGLKLFPTGLHTGNFQ